MSLLAKYFSKNDLLRIKTACAEAEQTTSGEIRVSIYSKRDREAKKLPIEEFTVNEFYTLKMNETRDKTGILILIILKERQFYILADKGIDEKIDQSVWDEAAAKLSNAFKRGEYMQGLLDIIQEISYRLSYHFPIKEDDRNELSDGVVIHE